MFIIGKLIVFIEMTDLINQINKEIEKYSLLKHEFYQMWQEGKLTLDHLSGYSKEYFQLVKIVPTLVENTLKNNCNVKYEKLIKTNLEEEQHHIAPWIKFASSLNVDGNELINYPGDDLTVEAVNELVEISQSSFEEGVASLYAFEKELPKISETKLDGLKKFYNIDTEEANEYFTIHEEVDIYHAKVWENILQETQDDKKEEILNAVRTSLKAQNKLLDSVKNKYVDKTITC